MKKNKTPPQIARKSYILALHFYKNKNYTCTATTWENSVSPKLYLQSYIHQISSQINVIYLIQYVR